MLFTYKIDSPLSHILTTIQIVMALTHDMTSVKNISLYVPRMAEDSHKNSPFKDLQDFVRFRFKALAIGEVSHIDFKKGFVNKDGRMYYKAFIHFNLWYDNPTTRSIQDRIFHQDQYNNSCAKLVYDDPHYWMLLEYKENQNKSKKQQAFELVSKLEQQLAQVAEMAEMFKLAQAKMNTQYENAAPGSKRSRMATYSY